MASAPALTSNSISAIVNGNTNLQPLLQVLDVKEIKASQTEKRFRLLLSDGRFAQQSVLATQHNASVISGQIKRGTILQLLDYICHTIRGLRFVMVLNTEVIGFSADAIGDPKPLLLNESEASARTISQPAVLRNGLSMGNGCGMENLPARPSESMADMNAPSTSTPNARPVVSPMYEPAPVYSSKGPIARNKAPARILPIMALSPNTNRWAIKGRVTAKTDLRRFNNAKGDGRFFSFDLLDGDGGEIRATCFNSTADQFIDKIEIGKLYMVSKGTLKPAQKTYNHLRHTYEITLANSSIIELLEEDDSIPQQQFNFTPIAAVENVEENTMVDVLGVVVGISPTNTILRKNGIETEKRTVNLRDASGCSVEITMWGSFCAREGNLLEEACSSGRTPILAVKVGRVSSFGGKSVGTISSTQLLVDPDLPEARQLRAWFNSGGKAIAFQPISDERGGARAVTRKTVNQIKEEGLGRSGKPDWVAVKGTISFVKTDKFCYSACPLIMEGDRQCGRKVMRSGEKWHCNHCDKLIDECEYRYLLSFQVQDHTGVTWVTAFQEAGEEIMGVSAKELQILDENKDPRFQDVTRKVLFTEKLFKIKVKEEAYHDELSLKCIVMRAEDLSFESESKVLLDSIRSLVMGDCNNHESTDNGNMRSGSISAGFMSSISPRKSVGVSPSKYRGGKSTNRFTGGGGGGGYASSSGTCFKCGKAGHWAKDCPNQGTARFRK